MLEKSPLSRVPSEEITARPSLHAGGPGGLGVDRLERDARGPGNVPVRVLEPFGIKELVQSGMVALGRGSKSITDRALRPLDRSAGG